MSCAVEQGHRFRRKGLPAKLVIYFKMSGDKPMANEAYVLDIDGEITKGQTGGDGKVEIGIPPNARKGKITFQSTGRVFDLDIGNLDPINKISGVQGRLRNLGFYHGPIDGELSDELKKALREFQERHKIKVTGEIDKTTRDALKKRYLG